MNDAVSRMLTRAEAADLDDLAEGPLVVLEQRQRARLDRIAERGIEARRLEAALGEVRREITDLTGAARTTEALLTLARVASAVPAKKPTTDSTGTDKPTSQEEPTS